jgi:hypothetical protein
LAFWIASGVAIVALQEGCTETFQPREFETFRVASIEVIPSSMLLLKGGQAVLAAFTKDADGNNLTYPLIEWASSNPPVATVDTHGLITAVAEGSASISATVESKTAEAAVTVVASVGGSQTYVVDIENPAASDNNPGTEALPWKTIYKAAATLNCSWTTPALNPARSGTADNPIAFRAYPGHRPLLTNSVTDYGCPTIGAKDRDYIIWDGFEVVVPATKGVVINSSRGVIIENCVVHGMRGSGGDNTDGIRIDYGTEILIRDNLIYDIDDGDSPIGCGATGVKMYGSEGVIMEHNEVYDVGCGLRNKVDGASNTFRYNWVHDCTQAAIHLGVGNGTRDHEVYSNIVARCETGIDVRGTSYSHTGSKIYNNTIVDMGRLAISAHGDRTTNIEAWNNIAYNSGSRDLVDSNSALSFCDYNLFWQTNAGCGSHSIVADPQFVDLAFDDPTGFKLQSGSPARGAGRDGEDIGAYAQGNEVIGRRR